MWSYHPNEASHCGQFTQHQKTFSQLTRQLALGGVAHSTTFQLNLSTLMGDTWGGFGV
jgi:hypothetical protein